MELCLPCCNLLYQHTCGLMTTQRSESLLCSRSRLSVDSS